MLQIRKSIGTKLVDLEQFEEGAWVNLVSPTKEEIEQVVQLGIDADLLKAALDEEERARIESEEDQLLVIVDVPVVDKDERIPFYSTLPLGIIIHEKGVVTVCVREDTLLRDFVNKPIKGFYTHYKNRFVLKLLLRNATQYLQYLREIEKMSHKVEMELHKSMKNSELIELLKLEKSLVYFSTSLKSNELVIEKLLRFSQFRQYEEDAELLEDTIIENKQAIEMATIYSSILSGTMDAFASVISNNLNIVMKFLASVTIVLSIPTIVFSFYGMNVVLPLQEHPQAYLVAIGASVAIAAVSVFALVKRKMF